MRESLCSQLGLVAEEIGEVTHEWGHRRPERYTKPMARFDRIRGLLDLIAWTPSDAEQAVTIITARDRETLRHALRLQLETEWDMLDVEPDVTGAPGQVEKAKRRIEEIEQFLTKTRETTQGKD